MAVSSPVVLLNSQVHRGRDGRTNQARRRKGTLRQGRETSPCSKVGGERRGRDERNDGQPLRDDEREGMERKMPARRETEESERRGRRARGEKVGGRERGGEGHRGREEGGGERGGTE